MPAPLIALALLAAQPDSTGGNWGTEHSALTSGPAYARSKATCRRLGAPRPPVSDLPSPAQRRASRGCDSAKLYYGQGVPADPVKARLCAAVEADGGEGGPLSGDTILMQLYANGLGVRRDLDLATAYACGISGAPAEIDGRVNHLQALKLKRGGERFDYCDDITSGYAEGFCQAKASASAGPARDARLRALVARLPTAARPLYGPVKAAFDRFVEAHGGGEVDQSGTARAAQVIAEEDAVRDQFVRDLGRLVSGAWPSAVDAPAADAALNAAYRKALAGTGGRDSFTTTKPDDVRKAQRAWLAYRDAYVRFARAAAPTTTTDAVLARLTRLRTAQLDALAD